MKQRSILLISFACVLGLAGASAQSVHRLSFNDNWTFSLDNGNSRKVNLPHDWAIEGNFSLDNPSGTGGGALPGGMGVYTKTFNVSASDKSKMFRLDFDGVYMNAEVLVNGKSLGTRPYGYISFGYDITPYLYVGKQNTVVVKVDNTEQPNSRWYSGCGIYRNVWLTKHSGVHVAHNGTYVTTQVLRNRAGVDVKVELDNPSRNTVNVRNLLVSHDGKVVAETSERTKDTSLSALLEVENPHLWDVDDPYLYTVVTKVEDDKGVCLDEYHTTIGIRTFEFRAPSQAMNGKEAGFILNGRKVTINGVCNHHDLGCLGSAVNTTALRRQLQILKDMGCNGIRCSHNPPAPELLDLCDRMGFIVMDEAFDMWRKKKTAHDYARYFNEWHEKDLTQFVLRDRNHPSVFMWSIGNEVLEQWSDANADTLSLEQANMILNFGHSADMLAGDGAEMSVNSLLTRKLADMVRELDPTRPVTAGCNEPGKGNHLFASKALDMIGFNYHNNDIPEVPRNFPDKPFIITESNSALMTRGYYRMPSDSMYVWPKRWDIPFADKSFSCSSYENCHVPWGNTHEENLLLMKKYPWISGQYIWTGFDYLSEPTPYGWPARSSYFGIIDLAGFPKDVYYLYQSEWTNRDVLHLFPHWNWDAGQQIDMWCYYNNADEVELFVNGKSQGVRRKSDTQLHAMWRVTYHPGEVTVVARKNGLETKQQTIRTASEPAQIYLTPERSLINADGCDLSFVTVDILDNDGNPCPLADNEVTFLVEGNAFIAGMDNGSPTSLESFKPDKKFNFKGGRKAFHGKCLVVLQNDGKPGVARLTASSKGLKPMTIVVNSGNIK